jgi:hypothetical protein
MASNPNHKEPAMSSIYHIPVDERHIANLIEEYEVAHANIKELQQQEDMVSDRDLLIHLANKIVYQQEAARAYYEELQLYISDDEIAERASI